MNRAVIFGDALRTLNIRPTPKYRRRIIVRAQLPFVIIVSIVVLAALAAGVGQNYRDLFLGAWVGLLVITGLALIVPWERDLQVGGLTIPTLDIVAIALMAAAVEPRYPTIGLLILLPVLVLAYAFGWAGFVAAVLGGSLVAALPLIIRNLQPYSIASFLQVAITPINVALLAAGVAFASSIVQRIQRKLEVATAASDNERAVILTVLETMDVGTAFVSETGATAFTNAAFRDVVKRSRVDPVSRAGTRVYATDRVTPVPPEHQMVAQAARGDYFESRLYWVGDGAEQRALLITARPVIGPAGDKIGTAFVSKDVTDLTDAIRAREDFLAGVSHELRTPLTSIIGYLEVIEDSVDAKAIGIDRELGIIQRNSNQLMMRIGDLLNVTDEHISLHRRIVDICPIVKQSVDAIRFRAENAGVSLEVTMCDEFAASVDPGRFAQVLDNLLTNAVKYTPRGGSIRAELSTDATEFTITVTDTGTGISATELRHIFDRFYRSESVRGGGVSGAGLGLAIVQNIVRAHDATIDVESELGVGTTFTVRMPRGV